MAENEDKEFLERLRLKIRERYVNQKDILYDFVEFLARFWHVPMHPERAEAIIQAFLKGDEAVSSWQGKEDSGGIPVIVTEVNFDFEGRWRTDGRFSVEGSDEVHLEIQKLLDNGVEVNGQRKSVLGSVARLVFPQDES